MKHQCLHVAIDHLKVSMESKKTKQSRKKLVEVKEDICVLLDWIDGLLIPGHNQIGELDCD
jgi:hypothetical protein